MAAEIICVGTELLLGDILNSNSQYLAQELAKLGIPHYYQSVVGDNPDRIKMVIQNAIDRGARILIFTGGLGPTPDDLTTETLAQFFGVELLEDSEVLADITKKFEIRGRVMSSNNRKQALIPEGAKVLPNPGGTAPGIIWNPREDLSVLTFPGVPREMHRMWKETAIPYLREMGWGKSIIYSRMMRFWGIGESGLAQKVNHLFGLSNPTVAPYAGLGEVRLRVSAKAASEGEAIELINPVVDEIEEIAGLDYYGCDEASLSSVVGSLLSEGQETLSVAESCTGGGLGEMITRVPGSSAYFMGGIISYDNEVKVRLLKVNRGDLAEVGAVSQEVAEQMAVGVKICLGSSWGLSITGIAGPGGGSASKPVGLVYIGLAGPDGSVISVKHQFHHEQGRDAIRYISASGALDLLRRKLINKKLFKVE